MNLPTTVALMVKSLPPSELTVNMGVIGANNDRCPASADRWVITASSQQDRGATQQISAQYLMLVGK